MQRIVRKEIQSIRINASARIRKRLINKTIIPVSRKHGLYFYICRGNYKYLEILFKNMKPKMSKRYNHIKRGNIVGLTKLEEYLLENNLKDEVIDDVVKKINKINLI